MGTWGQLLQELNQLVQKTPTLVAGAPSPHDLLRRKYLAALSAHTGRASIVYATSWMETPAGPPEGLSIKVGDVQAFMETCSNIEERELDLLITSPGGSPEAAESIVEYLRTQFDHIRVFIPVAAMSAGTMIALAADEIVMGSHSQLGPIDPQITVTTPEGPRSAPAQAILDQFEQAKAECADPANIGAWLPLLRSLLPGLLSYCDSARAFSKEYAERVLERYMFAGDPNAAASAAAAANYFGDFTRFKSHGRRVSRDDARGVGLKVMNLESDKTLQDLVLSVHHAVRLTYGTGAYKVVENHHGRAYIESAGQMLIQNGPPLPGGSQPLVPPSPPAPQLSRADRRKNR